MSHPWIDWLVQASFHLCLLVPAAWLLATVLRRTSGARAAYAAWLLVLPGLLPAQLLPAPHLPAAMEILPLLTVTPYGGSPSAAAAAWMPLEWTGWLAPVWLGGAVLAAGWMVWRQRRFVSRLEAGRVDSGRVASGRPAALREAGLPGWLPVRVSDACPAPMLVGCLPPVLYVPPAVQDSGPILAHEAAHLRHGDPLWSVLALALRCLFWFHPMAHLLWYRLRRDQELAADERVVGRSRSSERLRYACLLCRASGFHHSSSGPAHPPIGQTWPGSSSLKERIEMISQRPRSRKSVAAGLASVACATLLAGWVLADGKGTEPRYSDEAEQAIAELEEFRNSEVLDPDSLRPVVRVNPGYPKQAAEAGITGYVTMEATLNELGELMAISVVDAQPEGVFEAQAVQALSRWRMVPFVDEETGEPKRRRIRQTIEFRLDE